MIRSKVFLQLVIYLHMTINLDLTKLILLKTENWFDIAFEK